MQERVLAPWGNVEEVRSKRSDIKAKNATASKKDESKSKDGSKTSRGDPDKRTHESKSKSSSSRSSTSVAAASKVYSNGKAKTPSSTSKNSKTSSTTRTSTNSHSSSSNNKTKSVSANSTSKSADSSLKAKEKERLKGDIKRQKEGDKNNNVKQRLKEVKTEPPSSGATNSINARNHVLPEEEAKSKVGESRNTKHSTQTTEKRPETSGKSRRGSTATHETYPITSTSDRGDHSGREAKQTSGGSNSREHNSKAKTSDRPGTSRRTEIDSDNGKKSASARKSSVSQNNDSSILLPNKGGDKISNRTEQLVNGHDVAIAGGGRSSRAGSARSSRSRATSGSEIENYSDDFSSYDSDFDSEVDDDGGEGSDSSNSSAEEIESKPKRVQFHEPEILPEKLRPDRMTSEISSANNERNTIRRTRAHEILSCVHLDRSKHLALHFEGLKYDSYMAAFGARDRQQESIQTIERVEEECQTEPGSTRELWTQHPAKGAQGPVMGAGVGVAHVADALALSRFVQSAAAAILELLEEDLDATAKIKSYPSSTGDGINGLSDTQVNLPLYDSLPVVAVASAPTKASRLACVFKIQTVGNKNGTETGLALWDSREPTRPKELLTCQSSPERLTWLGDEIVVAALKDSSVAAWDLRRTTTSVTPTAGFGSWGGVQIPRRAAAFSSALADKELCQIVGLCSLIGRRGRLSDDEEEASIVTLDFEGHLVFWSLLHVQEADSNFDDLVLAPQATIKLVRSAGVKLSLNDVQFTSISVIDQELFVGCDDGGVLHLSRHAAPKFPKTFTSRPAGADVVEAPSGPVTCLCGVGRHLVVANGTTSDSITLRVFDRVSAYPLRTTTHWAPVRSVVPLPGDTEETLTSAVALLVNADHQLCRFDLSAVNVEPLYDNVESVSIHRAMDANYLVIGRVDGAIEVHTLS